MTLEDRQEIQDCLSHGMTFKAIGRRIGKDQTTISKEVKKHITVKPDGTERIGNDGSVLPKNICSQLLKAPFVCNGCKKRRIPCSSRKQFYYAKIAQKEYESLLSEAREGIPLTKESFYEMDNIVSDGIKRGQHLYHISQTNDLGVCKSTVYRHLHRGYLSVSAIDFPRVVKFKPRRKSHEDYVPKGLKKDRSYEDFQVFTTENNITSWVEMDTVIGRVGGKTIMTLNFTICNFMIGFLLKDKTSTQVAEKILALKKLFAANGLRFGDILPLILTDNGGEFANVFAIENDLNDQKETSLYFCDPYKSSQKPRVEKNHTLFRDIVPSGESFDHFTQDTVNMIFSHVNSVKRKVLNGRSPYEFFTFVYGEKLTGLLGIKPIPERNVIQSPKLLQR
jgi:IS30 family transposase